MEWRHPGCLGQHQERLNRSGWRWSLRAELRAGGKEAKLAEPESQCRGPEWEWRWEEQRQALRDFWVQLPLLELPGLAN